MEDRTQRREKVGCGWAGSELGKTGRRHLLFNTCSLEVFLLVGLRFPVFFRRKQCFCVLLLYSTFCMSYYKDDDGAWKPGKQGLAVSVERYKDLAGAILQVGEHLKANGLI